MPVCPHCQEVNDGDATHCEACGAALVPGVTPRVSEAGRRVTGRRRAPVRPSQNRSTTTVVQLTEDQQPPTPDACPDCGNELEQRRAGAWCARCRGWITSFVKPGGDERVVYVQGARL